MKALFFHNQRDLRHDETAIPPIGQDQVRLKVSAAGLSQTQVNEFIEGPFIINTQAHPLTKIAAPIIPCQEFGGRVDKLGENVDAKWLGKQVAVLPLLSCGQCEACKAEQFSLCERVAYMGLLGAHGGFAEYAVVNTDNLYLCEREDLLTFIEPILVALHSAQRYGKEIAGKKVLVIGAGAVGCAMACVWSYHFHAKVSLQDQLKQRLERAKLLGLNTCETVTENKFDIIIDCAGKNLDSDESAIIKALSLVKAGGTVINVGTYFHPVSFVPAAILAREVNLITTFLYNQADLNKLPQAIRSLDAVNFEPLIEPILLSNLIEEGYYRAEIDKDSFTRLVMVND